MGKKSKRPRFDEDLFDVLDKERDNPNQGIDEVLKDMFPQLEEMIDDKKNDNRDGKSVKDLF